MIFSPLTAISPIDGRYNKQTKKLKNIFSEYIFLKYRIKIEILWIKKLSSVKKIIEIPLLNKKTNEYLDKIINKFNYKDALYIKKIEKKNNHDVKSVEYFLKKKFIKHKKLKKIISFIHFSCTSEDINNLSYGIMIKKSINKIIKPLWENILILIKKITLKNKKIPLLARTHGQSATPTNVGKEFLNFYYRLNRQFKQLNNIKILGKFNGATGNYNSHKVSYPNIDWIKISKDFVKSLGISWNPYTTQIEPHDYMSELFHCIIRFNNILINLSRDIWGYISLNYFKQKNISDEVGSSTMPHKINPIDFENAEGNLELSNSMLNHMSMKLTISRWQRDLSDSTVLRNIGSVFGYSTIAYFSIIKGLKKIKVNKKNILKDLNKHWELLAEPIQILMKKYCIDNAYEIIKNFTKGKNIKIKDIKNIIKSLVIPNEEKKKLINMTPEKYTGLSEKMIDYFFKKNK
ncbi:adenylosuccinate lyase [Buchnera aphidicola (Taiwanaphis decaspermi)]|uniref:adenylosuccinate lyase n=1 Tax=Buchnera aphidicola TaxID=9 RepID=UPI0031B83BC2